MTGLQSRRMIAVIPAAGRSRRLGRQKLLLEFGGETLIQRLIRQLQTQAIDATYVLVRADDAPLIEEMKRLPVEVETTTTDTLDMRESVQRLLDAINRRQEFRSVDGRLLIPADHPIVMPSVLDALWSAWKESPNSIVVPRIQGRRGHPTIFPFAVLSMLREVPEGLGVNQLLRDPRNSVRDVDVSDPSILWDLDTPEDLERFRSLLG